MVKTLIGHFYNEEFLLPLWLNHHKKFFDHGILIDYNSTDSSVEIIKKICPNWKVIPSINETFDHELCDQEIQNIENNLEGWRIALTITEFLVGKLDLLMQFNSKKINYYIPVLVFCEYNPSKDLNNQIPLWLQLKYGIDKIKMARSLHNYNGFVYPGGRHFKAKKYPFNKDCMIFKYSNCLVGSEMIRRRLQIQNKVSQRDKDIGVAEHHIFKADNGLNVNNLEKFYNTFIIKDNQPSDCSYYVNKFLPDLT